MRRLESFRSTFNIAKPNFEIDHGSRILMNGSCFSSAMGERFRRAKFDVEANSMGILYDPLAIATLFQNMAAPCAPREDAYLHVEGRWRHYDYHSTIANKDRDALKADIVGRLEKLQLRMKSTDVVILTLGSAFSYLHRAGAFPVANCHKQAKADFECRLLESREICESLATILPLLPEDCQVILTLSPVRHRQEGMEMNAVSKAALRLACFQLSQDHGNVSYFPSYELMLDDLRDYRFYGADMFHPSEIASDYIWQRFSDSYFSEKTKGLMKEISALARALEHRPFNPEGQDYRRFCERTLGRARALASVLPVDDEIARLEATIATFFEDSKGD